jgi:hypothetical protein
MKADTRINEHRLDAGRTGEEGAVAEREPVAFLDSACVGKPSSAAE